MKKILTVIGAISLISTPAISVVGCLGNDENNDNDDHKNVFDMGPLVSTPTDDEIKRQIYDQFWSQYSLAEENMKVDAVTNGSAKVSVFDFNINKVVNFELKWTIVDMIPTKYIDSSGKEIQTKDKDLSELNATKITQIGYYYRKLLRGGEIQAVRMPKTVTEVPSNLPQRITSLRGVFEGITSEEVKGIENWNVANVKDMRKMFADAHNFNQDISSWNVANVSNMMGMFLRAYNFNQDISSWNVANVRDMSVMFANARNFNQDISSWDVANVTEMGSMFADAHNFNQDISSWNVANVWNSFLFANNSPIADDKAKWPVKFRNKGLFD